MSSQAADIGSLFDQAATSGALSGASIEALRVQDLGATFQAGLGVSIDDVDASEVVCVNLVLDDSGSMSGNAQTLRDAANGVKAALMDSKNRSGILMSARNINGSIISPYVGVEQFPAIDGNNYRATGSTPLYKATLSSLGTSLAKQQEFSDNGVPCRTVTLICTDGGSTDSERGMTAAACKQVIEEMYKQEMHIIAFMGFVDGYHSNEAFFRKIARDMGIQDRWVLTPNSNPKEIRAAFELFSQSAVQASQNAASFSKTSMGGFGS